MDKEFKKLVLALLLVIVNKITTDNWSKSNVAEIADRVAKYSDQL